MSSGPRQRSTPFRATVILPVPAKSVDDYRVYASYRITMGKIFFGALKVQRMTDKRILFPFEGCPDIGPFGDPDSATRAALELAQRLIAGDLQSPEA
jgi:hypothetical protein